MYFLSAEEERFIRRGLRGELRQQPVAEELRGWAWPEPPLKPIYDTRLTTADLPGGGCPTGRDVFLRQVQRVPLPGACAIAPERMLHRVVADVILEAKQLIYLHGAECLSALERLGDACETGCADESPQVSEPGMWPALQRVRAYEAHRIAERTASVLSRFRCLGPDALVALALPVAVDLKLDGGCLGLERDLPIDAASLPELLVFQLRLGTPQLSDRLATTARALVLESRFEAPCDLGCVVYVEFVAGRPIIQHDLHVIGDELRQVFTEERDERMRAVSMEIDPGVATECPAGCSYLPVCHPVESTPKIQQQHPRLANRRPQPSPRVAQTA